MESNGNRYFNPDNPTHQQLVDAVVDVLESADGSTLQTPTLAEDIGKHNDYSIKESTARALLYYAREYIVENKPVEAEKENSGEGGDPPWEWRLVE